MQQSMGIFFEVAKLLIENGPDACANDDTRSTPLVVAGMFGHLEVAESLVKTVPMATSKTTLDSHHWLRHVFFWPFGGGMRKRFVVDIQEKVLRLMPKMMME